MTDHNHLRDTARLALVAQIACEVEPYDLLVLLDENDRLREALRRSVEALGFVAVNVPWDLVQPGIEVMAADALYGGRAALESSE